MYVERNNEVRSCNHCCSGKAINITYSGCKFVACYPKSKAHVQCYIAPVAFPALQYFSTLSHKWHNFENKMCFNFLYNFVRNISHYK